MDNKQRTRLENFKRKAALKFPAGTYDYSRITEYLVSRANRNFKVEIFCNKHKASFFTTPECHLQGRGCPTCGLEKSTKAANDYWADKRLTVEEFINKAREVHGDTYNYSKVEIGQHSEEIIISCPHKEFKQKPYVHLAGFGCFHCSISKKPIPGREKKTEAFKIRAYKLHGQRFDFSKSVHVSSKYPCEITCPLHGVFYDTPSTVLYENSFGCPECKDEGLVKARSYRLSYDRFVRVATEKHKGVYDYKLVPEEFTNYRMKVQIICPEEGHGEFTQSLNKHMNGQGCPRCGEQAGGMARFVPFEEFERKSRIIHGDKYTYDESTYNGAGEYTTITCLEEGHGEFDQHAYLHYRGSGCPSCIHRYSKPHKAIEAFISSLGASFISNTRAIIPPKEIDIYLPERNLAIEFNGTYWHSVDGTSPASYKHRHEEKFNLCTAKGITLLQIDEHEWTNLVQQEVWKSIIASKLGKHKKIHARRTLFSPISFQEASDFLSMNHLQGKTTAARWCYGLHHDSQLVGVITFSNHEKDKLSLTRMSFLLNTTVVGGAQKLFKNALLALPDKPIVTFSNNQYSAGTVYTSLGFTKDKDLQPSYRWVFKGEIRDKRFFRLKYLPKILGDRFNPQWSERTNMFRAGGVQLFDAGYQRWIYNP